jgi:tripartite-type tricarboxylate transporter receptor subunit TctC
MMHSTYLSRSARLLAFIAVVIGLACSNVGLTHAQAPFFQGKTITIIQGRDPGGTGDLRTKALVPFLQKYLPGNPTIMMEYMPGAGGRMAANHLSEPRSPTVSPLAIRASA